MQHKLFVLKQSLKETHSFAPSFNLRRANQRRANLRRASGDPYILYNYCQYAKIFPFFGNLRHINDNE